MRKEGSLSQNSTTFNQRDGIAFRHLKLSSPFTQEDILVGQLAQTDEKTS